MASPPALNDETTQFLAHEEDSAEYDIRKRLSQRKRGGLTSAKFFVLGATVSSLLWIIVWNFYYTSDTASIKNRPLISKEHCGTNPTEARDLNCKFQLWSFSWVPKRCFDEALHNDFLDIRARENWSYYRSFDTLDEAVPLDVVLAGETNYLLTTWGEHYWHCAFYQRNFFRIESAITGGEKMTNKDPDEPHALHCQDELVNSLMDPLRFEWGKVNINLTMGYHQCY